MKIKHITHTDLDGIGCNILLRSIISDVDAEFVNYGEVDETVMNFLEKDWSEGHEILFITDLSVSEKTARYIERFHHERVYLLDHHPTALHLNDYFFATVHIENQQKKPTCGTEMVFQFLNDESSHFDDFSVLSTDTARKFVELVRLYDTWDWKTDEENGINARNLNRLHEIMDQEDFIEMRLDLLFQAINTEPPIFTEFEQLLLDLEEKKIQEYLDDRLSTMTIHQLLGNTIGVVYASQYHSELGNYLCLKSPEIDFCLLINLEKGSASLRSVKDDVHLGKEIALHFGGGGHQKAAGFQLSDAINEKVFELVTKNGY